MTPDQSAHRVVLQATEEGGGDDAAPEVPVNMYETTGAVVIVAPLPGGEADDVTIELRRHPCASGRTCAARRREYLVHEWDYGGYEREL